MIGATTIMIAAGRRSLADLPPPSSDFFALRAPWCPISARTLTETLRVDHGLLGCWRLRGIGPRALPIEWTVAHRHAYRVDAVLGWLALRQGEPFDISACWADWIHTNTGMAITSESQLRAFARRWAERDGLVLDDARVRFKPAGFQAYIESIEATS